MRLSQLQESMLKRPFPIYVSEETVVSMLRKLILTEPEGPDDRNCAIGIKRKHILIEG